jgi:hypothetical protein
MYRYVLTFTTNPETISYIWEKSPYWVHPTTQHPSQKWYNIYFFTEEEMTFFILKYKINDFSIKILYW